MYPIWTLFSSVKIKLGMAAALVGVFGLVAAPLANATPVSFYNDAATLTTLRFTLGCGSATGDCSGLLAVLQSESPYSFDSTDPLIGDLFDLSNSGIATETSFVNTAAGESFATGTKTQVGGAGTYDFSTSADYFLIKIGKSPNYALIHNLTGSELDLFFLQTGGAGSGFSHYTEFGGGTVTVPEPAELGIFGLGVLLVALFAGLRRRYN